MIESKEWLLFEFENDEQMKFTYECDTFHEMFQKWEEGGLIVFNLKEKKFFVAGELMYINLVLHGSLKNE